MRITTEFKRPSEEMSHFGPEVHQRLVTFEEHDFKRRGYNVKGEVVVESVREWKENIRRAPEIALLRTEYARELIPRYLTAMLDGAIKELRKVQEKSLEGSMRLGCRTEAKAQYHHDTTHHSIKNEGTFGVRDAVAAAMAMGSDARHMARTNARASDPMSTYWKASLAERRAVWRTTHTFEPTMLAFDKLAQYMHDKNVYARAMRAVSKLCHEAAVQYANAIVYHRLKRWKKSDIDGELVGLRKPQQLAQLMEQIDIILIGGGFNIDPARVFKQKGVNCCGYCGESYTDKVKHAVNHLKKLIGLVAREGWPSEAPHPTITLIPPPILNRDQSKNPVYAAIVLLQKKAVALVLSGKVEADIVVLKECKMPKVNASLVGCVMNYTFMIKEPGQRNSKKKTYTGIIKQAVTRVETARRTEVEVMTAVVEWTEAGDGMDAGEHASGVILLSSKYGKCDERDGWFVHPRDSEVAGLAKALSTVQASMQEHIMREYTCMAPKSEL